MIGQQDNLLADVNQASLQSVKRSECAHVAYQALSRGACRVVVDGEARPMTGWIIHPDVSLLETLKAVMPGVQVGTWEAAYVTPLVQSRKAQDTAAVIVAYVKALPPDVQAISTHRLKREALLTGIPKRTFTRALTLALERLSEWSLSKQSLIRLSAQ
jgi:hypothetical protein